MFKGFVREGELRRWAPWAAGALLILLAVALETGMEGVCWSTRDAEAAKINEAVGCFEFWFNRYQTLIGAIAALIAGYAAWQGAMKQVSRADTQINLLSKQAAVDKIEYINSKLVPIDELHRDLERARIWYNAAIEDINNLKICAAKICDAVDKADGSHIAIYEQEYEPTTRRFDNELFTAATAINNLTNFRENPIIPEEIRSALVDLCYKLAVDFNYIETFKPRVRTPTSIHSPGVDAVKRSYEAISRDEAKIPTRLDKFEVFVEVDKQRVKLLALRRAAEAVAEA